MPAPSSLAMGIDLIEWTYDPLQALNAHLNFAKLGVVVQEYAENIYGESSSPLHHGTPTDRFIADNHLKVVQKNADAALEGEVIGYQDRVFGFDSARQANEYIVIVTVQLTLRDRVKNKEIWNAEQVVGRANYFLESSTGGGVTSESAAREQAIRQVVDYALSRTVEGW